MKKITTLLFFLSIITNLLMAQDKAPQHKGFFARAQAGIGTLGYSGIVFPLNASGEEDAIAAGYFNADLGYSLSRNFALHITFGNTGGGYRYFNNAEAIYRITWGGIGASYYFIPSNFYISAAFASANLGFKDEALNVESDDAGGSFRFTVGKEWKVAEQWGIGVALVFQGYQWNKPENYIEATELFRSFSGETVDNVNASIVTLAFTATFN